MYQRQVLSEIFLVETSETRFKAMFDKYRKKSNMDEVENAFTGTGLSVYTALGISYCKIKYKKGRRQACHSHGHSTSELNSVLDLRILCLLSLPSLSPLPSVHSRSLPSHTTTFCLGGQDNCSWKEESSRSHSHTNPLLSVSIQHLPCYFQDFLTYSRYQSFTPHPKDCHGNAVNT